MTRIAIAAAFLLAPLLMAGQVTARASCSATIVHPTGIQQIPDSTGTTVRMEAERNLLVSVQVTRPDGTDTSLQVITGARTDIRFQDPRKQPKAIIFNYN